MGRIAQELDEIRRELPEGTRLVAVSKFHPTEAVREAYEAGQRIFGESHAQELDAKRKELPADIEWHFIGHLQTNKVKYIAPYVSMIHAVDSFKLLQEINKRAAENNRHIPCLLELHVAEEVTKYGFTTEACDRMLAAGEWQQLVNAPIAGIMCMASNTDDEQRIREDFKKAHDFFNYAKETYFKNDERFCERSYGMTHDYRIALKEQPTLVRIGTKIFGERVY